MSEFNSVSKQSYDTNPAFADAVQRARQIAAKIHSNSETTGTKRSLEDVQASIGLPDTKKLAVIDEKAIVQQLASIQAQRAAGGIANAITVEEWKVPDKMVGLIIGRGGEQITRLQAESGCKVQMAADSGGLPDRICTLTGSRQSIEKAKDLITSIINRGGPPLPSAIVETNHVPDGHSIVEMLIPGPKVGLVIGKGGETIRNLQERAAVKMVLIQDGPQQTSQEKPLRITGEPDKCEYAKQLVMDLITEKELESLQRGGFEGTNEYGSSAGGPQRSGGNTHEIMVPKQAVGVVIGKGGDMIKKIQQDSGARVQFLNVKDEGPEDKVCVVTGTPEQIQAASSFINDLIQSVRDQQNVGRGRGRGRGDGNPNFGNNPRRPDVPEVQYSVPASKCGLVIGKGGETVKSINQTSGAYVTLSALPPPNPNDKIFVIKGHPPQIEHAKELINEKIGGVGTVIQTQNPQNQQNFAPQFQQQQQQQFQQAPTPAQPYAPQGWGNAYQPWQGQTAPASDPNAAAWAAYYSQYYGQQQAQMQPSAAQPVVQPGVAPQPGMPAQPDQNQTTPQQPPAATPAAPTAAAPVGSAVAAQPDYSAAWAEYYRSLGMFREAEMIENQAKTQMAGSVMTPQQPGMVAPVQAPTSAPQATSQPAAPPAQPPPASVPPAAPPVQQPSAGAQAPPTPTGVPAPPGHPQGFPPGGPQPQWQNPAPFAQPFGQQQQPNAFAGYNYQGYGQQPFAAASAPQ